MDLFSNYPPSPLHFKDYLSNFSTHRNEPAYTITRSGDGLGRPLPRTKSSADHLAPGHYPVDRDIVLGRSYEEIPAGHLTRSASPRSAFVPFEDREAARERALSSSKNPGPSHYSSPQLGSRSCETVMPSWTVPRHLADASRPLPRAVTAADHLGPGLYRLPGHFDGIGWRKAEQTERAARRTRETWAGPQYRHIFGRLKPGPRPALGRATSSPTLPPNRDQKH
mmetsp:Transcript_2463/g.6970  ORF Transcript_2463/g.6970 Transcript_2463/m.6970 type:complete len:224 (-) Transcript_2463:130-801(-)